MVPATAITIDEDKNIKKPYLRHDLEFEAGRMRRKKPIEQAANGFFLDRRGLSLPLMDLEDAREARRLKRDRIRPRRGEEEEEHDNDDDEVEGEDAVGADRWTRHGGERSREGRTDKP